MSGPMPAGSPNVNASGCMARWPSLRLRLAIFDQGLSAKLLEPLLALGFKPFVLQLVADLPFHRRVGRVDRTLADGKHLDALLREFGRRELSDSDLVEDVAQLRREIGRLAHDHILNDDAARGADSPHIVA